MSSAMDASDEMLRFVMQTLRTGYKGTKTIVTSPITALNSLQRLQGNYEFVKRIFGDIKKTQKDVANAKTPDEIKKAIDGSYVGKLINLPGDNDKIIFAVKSKDIGDFAKYMKEHGEVAYILSDMKTPDGAEPYKMITVDKGELNKVQDFLRNKGVILSGRDTYTFDKQFVSQIRVMYNDLSREIELEKAREAAIKEQNLDKPVISAVDPKTNEKITITAIDEENISDVAENLVARKIDSNQEASTGFTQRSVENSQLKNDNLSERSGQELLRTKRKLLKTKSVEETKRESVISKKTTKKVRKSPGVKIAERNLNNKHINNEDGKSFAIHAPKFFKDDYVINADGLSPDVVRILQNSQNDGFTVYSIEDKTYISFKDDQISDFCLTLSPDASKVVDRKEVLSHLAVGDKDKLNHELGKLEMRREYTPKTSSWNMKTVKDKVKANRKEIDDKASKEAAQKANETYKQIQDMFSSAMKNVDLGGKIPDVPEL